MHSERCVSLYPDVDGSIGLLRYDVVQVGCCRVISHPEYVFMLT
jgi:hypothetical protein